MSVKNESIDEAGISMIKHSNKDFKMNYFFKPIILCIIMFANIPVEGQSGLRTDTGMSII